MIDASLGIIAKTNDDARCLYESLSRDCGIRLISPDSTHFENGITVTSIRMSKGLEFDEVIVPDASGEQYSTEYDRSLLYIACTRQMHKLSLLWTGTVSPLIDKKVN